MEGGGEGVCIVYSKRTARLVNSVELTPDGKMANAMPGVKDGLARKNSVMPKNLKQRGDVELGVAPPQKTGRQRFR